MELFEYEKFAETFLRLFSSTEFSLYRAGFVVFTMACAAVFAYIGMDIIRAKIKERILGTPDVLLPSDGALFLINILIGAIVTLKAFKGLTTSVARFYKGI